MNYQNEQGRILNYYLYGTVVTRYGLASLNHGMRQGNKNLLQKTDWYGKIHSLVSSSAIRWALRFYLQKQGYPVNRVWDEDEHINRLIDENFDPNKFYLGAPLTLKDFGLAIGSLKLDDGSLDKECTPTSPPITGESTTSPPSSSSKSLMYSKIVAKRLPPRPDES